VVWFPYPYHIVTFAKLNILASYVKVDDLVDRVIEGLRKAGLVDLE
jgi:hypothetical protein